VFYVALTFHNGAVVRKALRQNTSLAYHFTELRQWRIWCTDSAPNAYVLTVIGALRSFSFTRYNHLVVARTG